MEKCQKHACPDCSFCQFCSETRCRGCLKRTCKPCKLSIPEQIALHSSMNPDAEAPDQPIFYKPVIKKDADE
jgi:hypothetical protein